MHDNYIMCKHDVSVSLVKEMKFTFRSSASFPLRIWANTQSHSTLHENKKQMNLHIMHTTQHVH